MLLLWPQTRSGGLLAWFCLILIFSGSRLFLILSYRRINPEAATRQHWYLGYLLSSLAIGISWGLLSLVPTPTGSQFIHFLPPFAIAFVAMAAIPSYAPRMGSYITFLGSLTLTATVGFYQTRSQYDAYLASLFPLLAIVLYSTATRYNRNLEETLQLRHRQGLLLEQMHEARHNGSCQ